MAWGGTGVSVFSLKVEVEVVPEHVIAEGAGWEVGTPQGREERGELCPQADGGSQPPTRQVFLLSLVWRFILGAINRIIRVQLSVF